MKREFTYLDFIEKKIVSNLEYFNEKKGLIVLKNKMTRDEKYFFEANITDDYFKCNQDGTSIELSKKGLENLKKILLQREELLKHFEQKIYNDFSNNDLSEWNSLEDFIKSDKEYDFFTNEEISKVINNLSEEFENEREEDLDRSNSMRLI